ncbi:2347_t:CDS:1 [Acaulospora colombiana]|uniref:2347_t:CDS:1 n=1 Tax=Acaulospora colombiana TaxID=27376 RepID=A0ACA9KN33_9GLOM|nr:2347_t:CDS:1 [Acaulospora colombiana]
MNNSSHGRFQVLESENPEKIIDWSSAEVDIVLEKISSFYDKFNPISIYPLSYGFPLNASPLSGVGDLVGEIKRNLRKHYPLPVLNVTWANDDYLQRIESDFSNGIFFSDVDDKIEILRDLAIDELAHDLGYSSCALASKNNRPFEVSLSSYFLPTSKSTPEAANLESIGIKCAHSKTIYKNKVILEKLLSFKLTSFAQSLLDDWVIGQDPVEWKYHYNIDEFDIENQNQDEDDEHQSSALTVIRDSVLSENGSFNEDEGFDDAGSPIHSPSSSLDSSVSPVITSRHTDVLESGESVSSSKNARINEDDVTEHKPRKRSRMSGF